MSGVNDVREQEAAAQALELDFLRFFYDTADEAMGPASDDIYDMIKDDFEQERGIRLPEPYRYDEEEFEGDE